MAQIIPEYELLPEFKNIAKKIINKYPESFVDIDIDKIDAVAITNKERSENKKEYVVVKTVSQPLSMFCPIEYLFIVYLSDWSEMSDKHRKVLVAYALNKISPEKDGKVMPVDLKDYSIMIRTLGVDYMQNSNIPDIINDDIEWVKDVSFVRKESKEKLNHE